MEHAYITVLLIFIMSVYSLITHCIFLSHCFVQACGYVGKFKICGVLSAEHFGKQSDGFCLSLLLKAMSKPADGVPSGKGSLFEWTTITDAPLAQSLKDAVFNQFGCARFD